MGTDVGKCKYQFLKRLDNKLGNTLHIIYWDKTCIKLGLNTFYTLINAKTRIVYTYIHSVHMYIHIYYLCAQGGLLSYQLNLHISSANK